MDTWQMAEWLAGAIAKVNEFRNLPIQARNLPKAHELAETAFLELGAALGIAKQLGCNVESHGLAGLMSEFQNALLLQPKPGAIFATGDIAFKLVQQHIPAVATACQPLLLEAMSSLEDEGITAVRCYYLGRCMFYARLLCESLQAYERAAQLDPMIPELQFNIDMVKGELEREKRAGR